MKQSHDHLVGGYDDDGGGAGGDDVGAVGTAGAGLLDCCYCCLK